ncbi:hypothetical protein M569_16393, partial [Genlisea aurea]
QEEKFMNEPPIIPFDCTNQFQNPMNFSTTSDQDCQNQSWIPCAESQHLMLPGETQFLTARKFDFIYVTLRAPAFPSYAGYLGDLKQDIDCTRQMMNERLEGISIDDYTACSPNLRLPIPMIGDQFPFHSFSNLNFPDFLEPMIDTGFQPDLMDYQITGNFDLPRQVYNTVPDPCAVSMLNNASIAQ